MPHITPAKSTPSSQAIQGKANQGKTIQGKTIQGKFGTQNKRNRFAQMLLLGAGLSAFFIPGGCNRAHYRSTADQEAYSLIDEKVCDAGEATGPLRIQVDRSSRMFDPFNPDRPPMPDDDPASHRYMELVDGKKGYPMWHANGTTNSSENPDWWTSLPLDEQGVLALDADTSVRLALLHSPTYQQQLETLYLSALDVSSERFLLDTQFFGGFSTTYTADGPDRGGAGNSSSTLGIGPFSRGRRPLSMQRRFATGADLVVGIANSITWQLSGPDTQSANTIIDFTLLQPLLRAAGRDVVLERLTLSERTLLANVRAFEQYRRGFYLQVVTGRTADSGPTRRGGLFGGAGLEGFTGLGGGFGRVAGGGGGFANTGDGVPSAGGFIGLLQTNLEIQNQEEQVARLRDNLLRLEDTLRELLTTIPASQDIIPNQQLQVAQAQQGLFSLQSNLINQKASYQQQLDAFKRTLGLPPYICIEIRDPMLDQFKLISPELKTRRNEISAVRDSVGKVNFELLRLSKSEQDPATLQSFRSIERTEEVNQTLGQLLAQLDPIHSIHQQLEGPDMAQLNGDIDKLLKAIPRRMEQLKLLGENYEREREMICTLLPKPELEKELFSTAELETLPVQLKQEVERLVTNITQSKQKLAEIEEEIVTLVEEKPGVRTGREDFAKIRDAAVIRCQNLIAGLAEDVLAMQVVQARARTESVLLPEVELEPRDAVEIARQNRRDWMSARASLVNSWRAIELVADELESSLDLVFSGDVQNRGDNPFDLKSTTGRLRVGLQWDAPITRLQERNRYRQALIEYQQARRSYYQFEDSIWLLMRSTLRTIRANQVNFELQRYAVRIAARQITLNEDIRQIRESLSQASGPTAARDTLTALDALLTAQNTFLGVWVNYEVLRRSLDQELGTMQLDSDGLWIDPGPIRLETLGGEFNPQIDAMFMDSDPNMIGPDSEPIEGPDAAGNLIVPQEGAIPQAGLYAPSAENMAAESMAAVGAPTQDALKTPTGYWAPDSASPTR